MKKENSHKTSIKSIWIGSEAHGPIIGGQIPYDNNSNVIVTFIDDTKYAATFFTYDNVQTLRTKNKTTGECLNGKYFWASDMIIVEKINRNEIAQIIDNLLEEHLFDQVFKKTDQ